MPSVTRDLVRALAHPARAFKGLTRWMLLARYAELRRDDVRRARRELFNDRDFQQHLERQLPDVTYRTWGPFLYAVVRVMKPDTVVETGVASGVSSAHILRALNANGSGTLHSIDLPDVQEGSVIPDGRESGWIVPETLRGRWRLHLGDTKRLLPGLLKSLARVDIFLHDSDHSYDCMSFEFEEAFPHIVDGGLMMSDDTHLHTAWSDFCKRHGLRPTHVQQLGVTRKWSRS